MMRKPLCNHVHTSENSLAHYRSYKTDLPLSRLSFWSITETQSASQNTNCLGDPKLLNGSVCKLTDTLIRDVLFGRDGSHNVRSCFT